MLLKKKMLRKQIVNTMFKWTDQYSLTFTEKKNNKCEIQIQLISSAAEIQSSFMKFGKIVENGVNIIVQISFPY